MAIRKGDDSALTALFERYGDAVFRYALSRLGDRDKAMSVLNDVMLVAWKKPDTFAERAPLKTWLLGIARNKILDQLRAARLETVEFKPENGGSVTPEEDTEAGTWRRALEDCWRQLRDHHREALYLALCEGLPYEEIALLLKIPTGTVKSRVHLGKQALRDFLKARGIQE